MEHINRIITNICSDKLIESKEFYTQLFDFEVNFDSDWFVQLQSKDKQLELGIVKRSHEIVPEGFQEQPQGFYVTIVVEDVDRLYTHVKSKGFAVVQEPHDTFYGQRRLLIQDPDGSLVDVFLSD